MYAILVNDDNTLTSTQKENIMHRSKLVDTLWFLANPIYQDCDLSNATVLLEYLLPISKKYGTKILRKADEGYKEYVKYLLPENDMIDTELTSEVGRVEVQLTFIYIELDSEGNPVQRVRKTSSTYINVIPISTWSDIIPDSALSVIDQRIIKTDAQIRALDAYIETIGNNMVDNLEYNDEDETLYLLSKNRIVGEKVSVRDMLDDGIPVVDMDSIPGGSTGGSTSGDCGCECGCEDNVVEFGYDTDKTEDGCECGCEDNVVEFGYAATTVIKNDSNVTEF